jgi:hypothetical protein
MQHNPVYFLLLWLLCAFLFQNMLKRALERRFPKWYEKRNRDAKSVAAAGAFVLGLAVVTAVLLLIDLIWAPS